MIVGCVLQYTTSKDLISLEMRQHPTCSCHTEQEQTCLNLVTDKERIVLTQQLLCLGQITVVWHNHARLSLDWLHHESDNVAIRLQLLLQGGNVIVGNDFEPCTSLSDQQSEVVPACNSEEQQTRNERTCSCLPTRSSI
jgi:hypothetical protein